MQLQLYQYHLNLLSSRCKYQEVITRSQFLQPGGNLRNLLQLLLDSANMVTIIIIININFNSLFYFRNKFKGGSKEV